MRRWVFLKLGCCVVSLVSFVVTIVVLMGGAGPIISSYSREGCLMSSL